MVYAYARQRTMEGISMDNYMKSKMRCLSKEVIPLGLDQPDQRRAKFGAKSHASKGLARLFSLSMNGILGKRATLTGWPKFGY